MELSSFEIQTILKRFPFFEASYETILHKNLPTSEKYNIGLAIPFGKKYYIWFTFYQDKNVCFFMELNREKKIIKISFKECCHVSVELAYGTLMYVSCLEEKGMTEKYFIEDIYYYKGQPVYKQFYSYKLGYMDDFFKTVKESLHLPIYLPEMWWLSQGDSVPTTYYSIHHIQYRCMNFNSPFLNKSKDIQEHKPVVVKQPLPPVVENLFRPNLKKPQYRMPTVFVVSADIKFDIYHLYACGKQMKNEYYGVAYVPSYKSSVFMNTLFRKIRENNNIDYVEESEDEEDFENIKEDKYVDLKKRLWMECVFHPKFKKWVPVKVVDKHRRIVHINKL
jgi:hypothetical protein